MFENLAVLEVLKTFHNAGELPDLHFYRGSAGNEADLVLENGASLTLAEIKPAQTVSGDAMRPIANIRRGLGGRVAGAALIYGGSEAQRRSEYDGCPMQKYGAGWAGFDLFRYRCRAYEMGGAYHTTFTVAGDHNF